MGKAEQQRVRALLTEAITVLCKNGLNYKSKFSIEGLLGITIDDDEIFLVNLSQTIKEDTEVDSSDTSDCESKTPRRNKSQKQDLSFSSKNTNDNKIVGRARPRKQVNYTHV